MIYFIYIFIYTCSTYFSCNFDFELNQFPLCSTDMTSYFLRSLRLLHILQRINGYTCMTHRNDSNERFEYIITWRDIATFIFAVTFYCSIAVYYAWTRFEFRDFDSSMYLSAIFALNLIIWLSIIVICMTRMLLRRRLCEIINGIDEIDYAVSMACIEPEIENNPILFPADSTSCHGIQR